MRGLFTWVKYVLFWSILCQFCVNYLAILIRGGCFLGSNMSYLGHFYANLVRIIWRFLKDGVVYKGQICHILVDFVPILCELFGDFEKRVFFTWVKYVIFWSSGDFEKTGLFTWVIYVPYWSVLCQFCVN